MSDDEDVPKLPEDTLKVLQEFYAEQEKKNETLQKLDADSNMDISFDENWVCFYCFRIKICNARFNQPNRISSS